MRLYLFVLDGKPSARTELHMAQAALEDVLRDRRDVSDVWWDDEIPYVPRVYLYGGSHSDYLASEAAGMDAMDADISWEQEQQLIWPVDIGEDMTAPAVRSDLPGATMTLSVVTPDKKLQFSRVAPLETWEQSVVGRPAILALFASDAVSAVGSILKEEV